VYAILLAYVFLGGDRSSGVSGSSSDDKGNEMIVLPSMIFPACEYVS